MNAVGTPSGDGLSILHVITRFRRGGCEKNLLHTVRFEMDRGHDVHVAIGADSYADEFPPGVTVYEIASLVRHPHPRSDLATFRSLRRLVEQHRFDVVHTHQSKAGVLGRLAARRRARAVVHTVHMASFGRGYGTVSSRIFLSAERFCARFTDVIACVGQELAETYAAAGIGRREQYLTVRSPIEIDRFAAVRDMTRDERMDARRHFGIGRDALVVVAAGSLEPRKRFDLVLQCLAECLVAGGVELVIAGDGPEAPALTAAAATYGISDRVRLLGHVDDVPRLLGAADVFVHGSNAEGVPQVVLQALAAGVPVVAMDVEGLREVRGAPITVVSSTGAGLAEAVLSFASEPRPRPVELSMLEPWRPEKTNEQLEALHRLIARVAGPVTSSVGRAPANGSLISWLRSGQ